MQLAFNEVGSLGVLKCHLRHLAKDVRQDFRIFFIKMLVALEMEIELVE